MSKPTLIIMAAGMGSRYGGLKQIDPVGPSNELIVEYSAYDAIRAGFGKIIFVIKEETEALFREKVGDRISSAIPVDYVFQRLDDLPDGFSPPDGRVKPWGTGHAVYCCKDRINEPFVAINADDFYGAEAFAKVAGFLEDAGENAGHRACMVGYYIENTLTEHGYVSRGVCDVSKDGYLDCINERLRVKRENGEIVYSDSDGSAVIAPGTIASMNFWAFTLPLMREFGDSFTRFLAANRDNLDSVEFYLPRFVDELINDGKVDVKVLETGAKWFGVTYREDKPAVQAAIRDLVKAGDYPENLWGDKR